MTAAWTRQLRGRGHLLRRVVSIVLALGRGVRGGVDTCHRCCAASINR